MNFTDMLNNPNLLEILKNEIQKENCILTKKFKLVETLSLVKSENNNCIDCFHDNKNKEIKRDKI